MRSHLIHRPARDIIPPLGGDSSFLLSHLIQYSFSCRHQIPGPPELGAGNPYPVHHDRHPPCHGDDRAFHSSSFGDLHAPGLEPRCAGFKRAQRSRSWCTLIELSGDQLKVGAAVDDESRQDNEKQNCGGDWLPIIFGAPWIGPPAVVATSVYHSRALVGLSIKPSYKAERGKLVRSSPKAGLSRSRSGPGGIVKKPSRAPRASA
jgi:hypothetical protein